MTKVKICGITNPQDAQLAVDLGADFLGFNFFPGSKRYLDAGYAESIVERLRGEIGKVGVFVNQSLDDVGDDSSTAEMDMIQLHGDESQEFINAIRTETELPVLKAFRVGKAFCSDILDNFDVNAILLDAFSEKEFGGSGSTFDWSIAAKLASGKVPIWLAGGLTPDNVAEAIRVVRPYAVDVASGVESSPGKKDPKKLEAFIRNAKNA